MTAYRAGQRVRAEWPDGSVAEGVLKKSQAGSWHYFRVPESYVVPENRLDDGCTVTVLSEPRPDEPTGLGAVVAAYSDATAPYRRRYVRSECFAPWIGPDGNNRTWDDLINPIIVSEGWTPS